MKRSLNQYTPEILEAIRRRATELYRRSGELTGRDQENWYQAEAEITAEFSQQSAHSAVVVKVEGVNYTGEYVRDLADGYKPGEWQSGDPIPVRLSGDKLYLRRPNGHYLETKIVKKKIVEEKIVKKIV